MVYIVGRGEESVRRRADGDGGGVAMAMGTERSKPPLHNFNLPCLKWGNQKQLRCMKPPDWSNRGGTNPRNGGGGGGGGERGISFPAPDRYRRSSRSPPSKFAASSRNYDARHRQFKKPKPRIGGAGGGGGGAGADEGIEAFGKEIMFDLKTAADRMQDVLRKKVCDEAEEEEDEDDDDDGEDLDADQDQRRKSSSPPPATASKAATTVSAGCGEKEHEPRPWNLRTRRAACKAPATTNAPIGAAASPAAASVKGLRIEERKESSSYSPIRTDTGKLPRLRGGDKKEPRAKFTVGLSRKEIEDDFMAMVGHRPARRPKKRPRIVQKQMDTLFPGLWLGEVTVDTYKVPEIPDIGKR